MGVAPAVKNLSQRANVSVADTVRGGPEGEVPDDTDCCNVTSGKVSLRHQVLWLEGVDVLKGALEPLL
eukprot:4810958-Lingulodinium_polyedra.AAC.1